MKVKSLQNSKKLLSVLALLGFSSHLAAANLNHTLIEPKSKVACAVSFQQLTFGDPIESANGENAECNQHPTDCGGITGKDETQPVIKPGLLVVTKEQCKATGGIVL